ncbi:chemotaxis response regulator protein-glutamate methylesterase [Neobacillus sp. WH10]|uniref:protein-glutamate methylesterase/protein-glutamine glutaminase n=1 Tax=Neobacillus sp. WH10 TaxID=3047873 RepID=UPI0024C1DBC5|nr:chemotaxis response regulator protein-glutamate methylesterase [Neobacillus sp. WH10]WHY79700.1 chemotaxis response regulator protein-glutamate methylesterase [Neobacillus sp. WH10]
MKQYSVLVVDDSAFMRRAISNMLEEDPQFHVIGIARNGVEAVEKVQRLKPDLVTMDVEMPKMNGLQALEQIMQSTPVSVVMLSSRTGEGAKETLHALELGAVDFFLKENLIGPQNSVNHSQEFFMRLRGIVEAKLPREAKVVYPQRKEVRKRISQSTDLIFIGCSTGGPSALQTILPHFPANLPIPIVVAQHMPPGFTKPLAERFNSLCQLNVKEAQNGQLVRKGTIYIAPSGFQTRFEKKPDGTVIFKVDNDEAVEALYKPSIDITLNSAAPIFADRLLSVILTGMGVDGMQGCGIVKKYHGSVFVEAEDSCIVYGMPKAVLEAGYADKQFALSQMYQEIMSFI